MDIKTETQNGNIALCEFMGRTFQAFKENNSFDKKFDTYEECVQFIFDNKLVGYFPEIFWQMGCGKYDSDYNWQMEVIDKIESMNNGLDGMYGSGRNPLRVNIERLETLDYRCSIMFNQHPLFSVTDKERKIAIFKTLVEFAHWYKEQMMGFNK